MKHINRRKNGGSMLIEPLENAYEDLKDGDEYVYLGKHNRVLNRGSKRTDDNKIGKVVWMYNVKDNYKVVAMFDTFNYIQYKEYVVDFKGLIERRAPFLNADSNPVSAEQYMGEVAEIRKDII